MSIHGYPADKSILIFICNLKLGLLKLQEETAGTSHADIDQDDVSLPGVLLGALGRAVCYCFIPAFVRRCWAIIRGVSKDQSPSASRGPSFCVVQTREFKQASRLNVGNLSQGRTLAGRGMCFSYSTGKRTSRSSTASQLLSFYQLQKTERRLDQPIITYSGANSILCW